MKVKYDAETDVLTIELRAGHVAESEEGRSGAILDYDDENRLVAIEILDASRHVDAVDLVQLQISPKAPRTQPKAAE